MVDSVEDRALRILHVLRAPIGGLWRHVVDLTREQVSRGHRVGIIADALTGGARADSALAELGPKLELGLSRVPMRRNPHPSDVAALLHVGRRIGQTRPDVVHGHGSKGGALARIAFSSPGAPRPVRVYTPHGGSLNYRPETPLHRVYMTVEAALQRRTDLLLFESEFIASRYKAYVGSMPGLHRVVHNGIGAIEFEPVHPREDATDFLYVGELRSAKGIDTLLAALARVGQFMGTAPTLTLVGSGPDRADLEAQAARFALMHRIVFRDPMPAREAFALGTILVVPSRAESLPYIVLEAAGARIPIIATNVGGIPEIFGPLDRRLIKPDSVPELGDRMMETLLMPADQRTADARLLSDHVRRGFSVTRMVDGVLGAYREAQIAGLPGRHFGPGRPALSH